jgi:hypothetical protein
MLLNHCGDQSGFLLVSVHCIPQHDRLAIRIVAAELTLVSVNLLVAPQHIRQQGIPISNRILVRHLPGVLHLVLPDCTQRLTTRRLGWQSVLGQVYLFEMVEVLKTAVGIYHHEL